MNGPRQSTEDRAAGIIRLARFIPPGVRSKVPGGPLPEEIVQDPMTPDAKPDVLSDAGEQPCRFFVTYTGVKLPFKLVEPIEAEALTHRNTFIRAYFDEAGQLSGFDKMVYGEIELAHRYQYHANGSLRRAEVTMDEETVILTYDEAGAQLTEA